MTEKKNKQRNSAFDLLRIIAAFSVVMLHSAAQFWYELPVSGREWQIANGYDACFRFGVPVFVMISGALFLGREKNTRAGILIRHNIVRLWIIYFLWSAVYGLWDASQYGLSNLTFGEIGKEMLSGRYHLWFVPMIAAIYLLCPVLYEMVHKLSKEYLQYFLGLFFVMEILRRTLICFVINSELKHILEILELPMVGGYLGYFILGYYIYAYGLQEKTKKLLYLGLIPSFLFNVIFSTLHSIKKGAPSGEVYDCFCIGSFCIATALFVFILDIMKKKAGQGQAISGILKEIAGNTLGIYLMHILALEFLKSRGIHTMNLPIAIGIPVMSVGVFAGCGVVSALLRRIPVIGKYIC